MTPRDYLDQASLFVYILMFSSLAVLWTGNPWSGLWGSVLTAFILILACYTPKDSFYIKRLGRARIFTTLLSGLFVGMSGWFALAIWVNTEVALYIAKCVGFGTLALLFLRATFEIEGSAHDASWRDRREEEQ